MPLVSLTTSPGLASSGAGCRNLQSSPFLHLPGATVGSGATACSTVYAAQSQARGAIGTSLEEAADKRNVGGFTCVFLCRFLFGSLHNLLLGKAGEGCWFGHPFRLRDQHRRTPFDGARGLWHVSSSGSPCDQISQRVSIRQMTWLLTGTKKFPSRWGCMGR